MDFIPYEGGPQRPLRPLARVILAGLTILAVVLGAATVLARPTSGSSARPTTTLRAQDPAPAFGGLPANADRDVGPGEAESELARLPETRH
jgi:hypothetical protein